MKRRTIAAVTATMLVLSFVVAVFAAVDKNRPVKPAVKAKTDPLISMLPASDAVVTVDGKRFFGDALPKVLSANQKLLGEVLSKLNNLQSRTGVDLRRFDSFVAGVNIIKKAGNDFDFDPVVIARGSVDSAAVIESVKKNSDIRHREETVAGKTIYIVSSEDVLANLKQNVDPALVQKHAERINDLAVTAIDGNTLAIGSLVRVRETVEHKTSVSPDLIGLLGKKAPAVANFAAKVPGGLSTLLPLDNDELGANIDSIKTIYGNADLAGGQATISVTGRTLQAQQAIDLKGTLEGLRDLGKAFLGGSKAADKQLYARLLTNVRISQVANELSLDLAIPQSDLDALVAIVSK
ncbi:MAG: hypothetical protein ACJ72Z_08210 [Pyrinomonadaceae bacterium]